MDADWAGVFIVPSIAQAHITKNELLKGSMGWSRLCICWCLLSPALALLQADGLSMALTKQLIGNNDEVTDIRFLGPPAAPTHIAVSSNSEVIRVFSLTDMSCTASLAGHTDTVLSLDAAAHVTVPKASAAHTDNGDVGHVLEGNSAGALHAVIASGSKDNQVRVWNCGTGRCLGVGDGHVGAVSAVAFTKR